MITVVAAVAKSNLGIGLKGQMPWHIARELRFFRNETIGGALIMGRVTADGFKNPLDGRTNIIVSHKNIDRPGFQCKDSMPAAIEAAKAASSRIYIIGGASIYKQAAKFADRLLISWIDGEYEADTFFPIEKFGEAGFDPKPQNIIRSEGVTNGQFEAHEYYKKF